MNARAVAVAYTLIAALWAAAGARAGMISPCQEPFAYKSAVNVYVLEDGARGADAALHDARKRLAWLVKLDALFRDSYGSLGAHFLRQMSGAEPCTLDQVIGRTLRQLPPDGAAAFVDQRVYREGQQILVQSYLHFFRIDADRRVHPEIVALPSVGSKPAFTELLPAQRLAFPPRTATIGDLVAIEKAFDEASLIYPEPRRQHGQRLPLSADQPTPYLVTEMRPDGWMRIDATPFHGDLRGWLHADPRIGAQLRERLPELGFLEGAVGYLSWLQARDGHTLKPEAANRIAQRAGQVLAHYAERGPQAEKADPSTALAEVLRAAMALDDPARAGALLPPLVNAAQRTLPDSRLRDLLGITRFAACCRQSAIPKDGSGRAAWLVGLSGALNDFQGALSIDPSNDRALANLDAVYAMLGRVTEYPELFAKISPLPDSLRDAYDRALARLPQTRAELDTRITEIRSLRQPQ